MAGVSVPEAKALVCDLCKQFYNLGWASGTGGGISIKAGDQIVMAPSGVQKERMCAEDMFVLSSEGTVVHTPPPRPPPYKAPKLSECSPLFMLAYELRNAGAVMHSHSLNAVMATLLFPDSNEFTVTHLEMIKGIAGQGFYSNCVVPIIENTARECELTDRLRQAMLDYPQANAVLVRRHGVYVWGDTWIQAKTQAECYDYLFEAAVRMKAMGIDASKAPVPALPCPHLNGHHHGAVPTKVENGEVLKSFKRSMRPPTALVLDIEGTVAPITYITETMFPYATRNTRRYLETHWDEEGFRLILDAILLELQQEAYIGDFGSRQDVVAAAVSWVEWATRENLKIRAFKQLQGLIWEEGFRLGELKGELFPDVADCLVEWRAQGLKTYVYSSGSRLAQRLFFGFSKVGDLRPYLNGFFDTTSGPKKLPSSYQEIALTLGVDQADDILFATDNVEEAQAATSAGWRAVLVHRPGNDVLPEGHGFRVITTMKELLK